MAFNSIYDIAGSAMRAQSVRLNTIASNLANADSAASSEDQAFRAIKPVFSTIYQALDTSGGLTAKRLASANVTVAGIVQSDRTIERRLEPGSPLADGDGYVYAPDIDPVAQMVDLISASRSYQANVEVFNTAKELATATLNMGK